METKIIFAAVEEDRLVVAQTPLRITKLHLDEVEKLARGKLLGQYSMRKKPSRRPV